AADRAFAGSRGAVGADAGGPGLADFCTRVRRQRVARGHAALRRELRRPPVRQLGRTTWGWPGHHARRGNQRARRTLGTAAQGRWPDALFAPRRRARRAALFGARVPVLGGDAPP